MIAGPARHRRDQHRVPATRHRAGQDRSGETQRDPRRGGDGLQRPRREDRSALSIDFNAFLAKINPSLPNLSHDIEAAVPTFTAYGDAAPDLVGTFDNSIRLSNSIVEEQQHLDEFLISSIGLADIGNEVIGGNRQAADRRAARCSCRRPTLAGRVSRDAGLHDRRPRPVRERHQSVLAHPVQREPDARYRALPLARGPAQGRGRTGGRSFCKELGLPNVPAEFRPPFMVG